jgi:hypothetical protein
MKSRRPPVVQDAILLAGDWHWRKGPRWKAFCARLLGRREEFVTHLGDVAHIAWWRGQPYLIDLSDAVSGEV